ncbi:hypothetical protein QUF70_15930 [Desulfobacterales bacterium HSG17]|nr:hypothetical protein [Desulfobacterales bacterium HSG17]
MKTGFSSKILQMNELIEKMRINFKQEELIENLMNIVRSKFPEVELINISESPEDSESLWINVTAPGNEDKEIELRAFASDKTTDILIDYGYHMLIMPTHKKQYKTMVA